MSRFTVVWWRFAKDKLADLWLDATDKADITRAADEIDRRLAADPESSAEDCHEGLYRLMVDPIAVQFSIDDFDRRVTVWTVRRSDGQSSGS